MSSSDVYLALQRGTLDGAISGASSLVSRKWYEIADYVQKLYYGAMPFALAANLDFWNSLTPEQQRAINEAARVMEEWDAEASMKGAFDSVAIMEDAGLEIWEWPAEEWERMRALAVEAIEVDCRAGVSEELWDLRTRTQEATKDGTLTWQEMIRTREF